jgi:hypothetical protein
MTHQERDRGEVQCRLKVTLGFFIIFFGGSLIIFAEKKLELDIKSYKYLIGT